MGQFPDQLSFAQDVLLVVVPAITGSISFLGSGTILYTFSRHWKIRMSNIKYRLVAAICVSDLFNSALYAIWSVPLPKEIGVYGSFGNQASCSFAGFMAHLGNIGGYYNGGLAIYFLMSIRYGMRDEDIAKKYELSMHLMGLGWPLVTGIIAYVLDVYSFGGVGCWIAPRPYLCALDDTVPCTGGKRAHMHAWVFTGIPLYLCSCMIVVSMMLIYWSIKATYETAQQQAEERNRMAGISLEATGYTNNDRYAERIKEAGTQAVLYSAAYLLTHMWAYTIELSETFFGPPPYVLVFLHVLCWPLQGGCNVFIFLRPTIGSLRRRDPTMSFPKAAYIAAFREDEPGRMSWNNRRPSSSQFAVINPVFDSVRSLRSSFRSSFRFQKEEDNPDSSERFSDQPAPFDESIAEDDDNNNDNDDNGDDSNALAEAEMGGLSNLPKFDSAGSSPDDMDDSNRMADHSESCRSVRSVTFCDP